MANTKEIVFAVGLGVSIISIATTATFVGIAYGQMDEKISNLETVDNKQEQKLERLNEVDAQQRVLNEKMESLSTAQKLFRETTQGQLRDIEILLRNPPQ